ncbi:monovalent cation/H(+) antiporter subunit G [Draconibacterium halophilum]|uniref:Monovalent cation/H(+) antiporter subunit G n=1 Tax=Draconibacterium halophilum TaxID=2706887 RepID=A0A6C0R9R5_9BACT|nr:monovalent cation/H(+) antiporter subunit G [Draconibacterium halophilum]QIA06676.1 monovalent cation/H(+) antiporter subunit G [Draconibacterium halophilum]
MTTLITALLFLLGAFFILVSAIGLVRFPDLYTRMHATTKATSFGILLIILGTALYFNSNVVWIKSVLVIIFIYLTTPLASHSIAQTKKNHRKD